MLKKIIQTLSYPITRAINKLQSPVFIVGCGHSGTSIILTILSESRSLNNIPIETELFVRDRDKFSINYELASLFLRTLGEGKTRFIEKTPRHIRCVSKIMSICPRARVIIMIRDARDVVNSLIKRGIPFEEALNRWIDDNESIPLTKSDRVYLQKLEDFVENPEKNLRNICSFLCISYTKNLLQYHLSPRKYYSSNIHQKVSPDDHLSYRNWQINQKLFSSVTYWQSELSYREQLVITNEAKILLQRFSYPVEIHLS